MGVFILLASFMIGYGGLGACMLLYLLTYNQFWVWAGSGFYDFSWILFGLGFIISGRQGLAIIKNKLYKLKNENVFVNYIQTQLNKSILILIDICKFSYAQAYYNIIYIIGVLRKCNLIYSFNF